jgi:hypothetical protein
MLRKTPNSSLNPNKTTKMTTKELLRDRYEVIADYPGSQFRIGDILIQETKGGYFEGGKDGYDMPIQIMENDVYACKNIFRKLSWWEKREESEMPEYIKLPNKDGGKVYRVDKWVIDSDDEFGPYHLPLDEYCRGYLPATLEEYNNYINSKQ